MGSEDRYKERVRRQRIMEQHFTYRDFGKGYPPHEFIRNYNAARVQYIQSAVNKHGEGMCAQRFFECLAIGPVLCNWCPDLERTGLVDGEDFLSYRTDTQMLFNMRLLLADENLRRTMAASGRKKSLMYHTYDSRCIAIINVVREYDK